MGARAVVPRTWLRWRGLVCGLRLASARRSPFVLDAVRHLVLNRCPMGTPGVCARFPYTLGRSIMEGEVRRRLRLGFIGGGLNSAVGRAHAVASQMDGRWELVAGAFSTHGDVNRQTGTTWGVDPARVYESGTELLDKESGRLDAVVVLTPTPQHEEQVSALLSAGYDVISEKSLAGTSQAALDLYEFASAQQKFLAVIYNYSGYPMIRELRARIGNGELGRVLAVHVEMPSEWYVRRDAEGRPIQPQEWRQHDGAIPMLSLDLGTHAHHLVSFILRTEPLELVATQAHHGAVGTVTDYASCLARYPDAVDVNMWFGKCALGTRNGLRLRVYGELAAAEWMQMNPEEMRFSDARGDIRVVDRASPGTLVASLPRYERFKVGHPSGFLEAFANLYWDLADSVRDFREDGRFSSEYVCGARQAADGLRMMEAIALSAAARGWCKVGHE